MILYVCVVAGETIRVVLINTSVVIPAPLSRCYCQCEEKYLRREISSRKLCSDQAPTKVRYNDCKIDLCNFIL